MRVIVQAHFGEGRAETVCFIHLNEPRLVAQLNHLEKWKEDHTMVLLLISDFLGLKWAGEPIF